MKAIDIVKTKKPNNAINGKGIYEKTILFISSIGKNKGLAYKYAIYPNPKTKSIKNAIKKY
ncbi:hypothetical protein [Aliivibrio fischeri]|uniref:hypothetical protein n=1 Tax=Aliivibrio fischeri TaxID=668 RepID=UPI001B312F3D|nr:hypothetical protein [Aliivibrio fischeri]MBP3154681.1 hypothetical protein [Aliivibrio fischeri]